MLMIRVQALSLPGSFVLQQDTLSTVLLLTQVYKGRGQNYFGRDPAGSCRIPTKDDTRYFLNKLAVETQKAEVRARGG